MQRLNAFTSGLVFVLAIAFSLVAQLVASFTLITTTDAVAKEFITICAVVAIQVCNLLAVVIVMRISKDEKDKLIHKPALTNSIWSVIVALITMVGFFSVSIMFSNALAGLGIGGSDIEYSGAVLVIFIIDVVIIAPICEELLFRYAMFTGFARDFSPVAAVIFSATAFVLYHMNAHQMIYQFAIGIMLSLVMYKTGNVLYCIFAHAISNTLALCIPSSITVLVTQGWFVWIAIALAIGAIVASVFVVKAFKMEVGDKFAKTQGQGHSKATSIILYSLAVFLCLIFIVSSFIPQA